MQQLIVVWYTLHGVFFCAWSSLDGQFAFFVVVFANTPLSLFLAVVCSMLVTVVLELVIRFYRKVKYR